MSYFYYGVCRNDYPDHRKNVIEEIQFSDLEDARELYEQLIETTSYQRVLVLLLEKPDPWQENIL